MDKLVESLNESPDTSSDLNARDTKDNSASI
jgi:hypothetical protein